MMRTHDSPNARRVIVSYPPGLEPDERDALDTDHYRAYLRRTLGQAAVGDEREEFVNCGCGTRRDLVLRIEAVEGGTTVDGNTTVSFVERTADESTADDESEAA